MDAPHACLGIAAVPPVWIATILSMSGPEGWQRARRDLGEALDGLDGQTRQYQFAKARLAETAHLIQESAHLEARLQLAQSQLDLATLRERRSRSNHEHTNELALRRGAPPDSLPPYIPDTSFAEAQAEFDSIKLESERVSGEIQKIERALRARFGLQPI